MYLPEYFAESRTEVLHAMMRGRPLATLVASGESGLIANHMPVETLTEPVPLGMLRGHIARANPLWKQYRTETEALAIFQGPQAYISPSFYPTKQQTGEVVPTWDYAVVHARGPLRFVHDAEWLHGLVTRLTNWHEGPRGQPWKVSDAPLPYIEKMLSLIVGFELPITSITGKWKLSQNHPAANRQGVVDGLQAAADGDSHAVAAMLSSFNDRASVIETARLVLRKLTPSDAPFILELLNEPDFLRFIGDKGVRTLEDARNYILKGPTESYRTHGHGLYLTALRDGTSVGICGLLKRNGLSDPDIGFAFLARFCSMGFATESAAAVLNDGWNRLKMRRIVAIATPGNDRSIAVLTKIGLRFERMIDLEPGEPPLELFAAEGAGHGPW